MICYSIGFLASRALLDESILLSVYGPFNCLNDDKWVEECIAMR